MKKNIKLLIENVFDDIYDIEDQKNQDTELVDNMIQQQIQKIKPLLLGGTQKAFKQISLDDLNNLPDGCFKLEGKPFSKKPDIRNRQFRVFIYNLVNAFKLQTSESKLLNLNFIDTSNITSFEDLFHSMNSYIDISRWNTSNVTNLNGTFTKSYVLKYCDISEWDVSNVTRLYYTFSYSYITYDLSKWNFKKLEDMRFTFNNIQEIDFDFSKWNTSTVQDMSYAFNEINFKDKNINIKPEYIENLNVSSCENFNNMFGRYNGPDLTLDKWNFSNNKNLKLNNIFNQKSSKSNIDISSWINKLSLMDLLSLNTDMKNMFSSEQLLNKILISKLSLYQVTELAKSKYFRELLKDYTIKFEKQDN